VKIKHFLVLFILTFTCFANAEFVLHIDVKSIVFETDSVNDPIIQQFNKLVDSVIVRQILKDYYNSNKNLIETPEGPFRDAIILFGLNKFGEIKEFTVDSSSTVKISFRELLANSISNFVTKSKEETCFEAIVHLDFEIIHVQFVKEKRKFKRKEK
jgi:hypothetical protein